MPKSRTQKGFTLIELLIVVAVVAILAAVGYPSYQSSVRKAARTEAQSALSAAASAMERLKAVSLSYASGAAGTTFPDRSPDSGTIKYNLSVVGTPTATTYVIRAASTDAQDGDSGAVEIMMINQAGQTCMATKSSSTDQCVFGTDTAW